MSTHEHTPTVSTSAVQNTGGRSGPQGLEEPTPDEVLRELCDKNYHQLLPLIAEKMQKEKEQQDKLNAVKARLLYSNEAGKNQRNHEESHYSESKTPTARTEPKRRHGNRRSRSPSPIASVFKRLKQNRPPSPRPRPRKEGGVFNRLGGKERSASARSDSRHQVSHEKETEDKSHVKTYDGSGDPEDHLKLFQVAAKTERWAMPTWCHMFNSTLTGNARVWFDKLPRESIDSYEDLRTAFREFISPTDKTHQGSGGDTSYQAKRWRIHGGLYGKIQSKNPGCGRSAGMHEDLRIHARRELGTPDVRGRRSVLRSSIRTLLRQAPARNKMQIDPATNVLMRQNGHKKDPCRTIHNTRNVKIPGKRRNGVRGEDILAIHPEYPEQTIAIGSTLTEKGRKELCALLRQNLDIFAWKPADMTGVPWHMAEHHLNVREGCPPVRQKKRGKAPERNKAIQEEVEKLVDEGIMKEVHYHSWLSNPVLDGYPLPEIDWKVESLCGYPFKCFLDAYKGYHQIKMAEKDEEKIAFITSQGIFCYTKMPFGLKNAEVNGSYIAKESGMVQYLEKVKTLASNFKEFSIKQVPRSKNKKADALSKIASTSFAHLSKQVLMEELKKKSIHEKEVLAIVDEEGKTWMTPIYEYLTKEILPEDKKKARVVRRKASRYTMINETLYKKSFLGPWLRCVRPLQTNYVLREIHEGSCSMHSGPRSVVTKAIRTGYYWPTMHTDARKLIRECNDCQEGPGKVKFLIVSIDYFTKWIEAKPVATITGNQVKKFVWDNIVCRFGLPGEIVSDMDAVRDNHSKTGANTCIRLSVFALRKAPKQMAWSKEQTGVWEKESKLDWMKEARIG
ncbi:reverse transcriptase domain-containing protein [Tanacetum coccineum]